MEILAKLLGGASRVKVMRLFLSNPNTLFKSKDIAKRSRVDMPVLRKELSALVTATFLKKRASGFVFNNSFRYVAEFERLLIGGEMLEKEAILSEFKKSGKLKLLIVSGVFINNKDARVDVLVVGDKLKKGRVDESIRRLEAETGAELVYAVFETKEFFYRLSMYDKLVRDILDFPHEVLWQAKELSMHSLKKD